ncbi:MAG: helix-turn-helix transcriptional regulator [Acidimicrobiales bacterium]
MAEEPIPEYDATILAFPGSRSSTPSPDPLLRDVVGEVLRDERHRQGRTLADVAEDAAVSVQYLSEIERGRKEVSSDVLHAIHGALGIDLGEFLERSTQRLRPRAERSGPVMLAA